MDERDVARLLRELPRTRASAGFAARVGNRIAAGSPRRRRGRLAVPALAAAAVFAVVAGIRIGAVRRDRELQRETRALAREIDEMKRALPSPLVEVGGEDGARYVVDLRRLPGRREGVL